MKSPRSNSAKTTILAASTSAPECAIKRRPRVKKPNFKIAIPIFRNPWEPERKRLYGDAELASSVSTGLAPEAAGEEEVQIVNRADADVGTYGGDLYGEPEVIHYEVDEEVVEPGSGSPSSRKSSVWSWIRRTSSMSSSSGWSFLSRRNSQKAEGEAKSAPQLVGEAEEVVPKRWPAEGQKTETKVRPVASLENSEEDDVVRNVGNPTTSGRRKKMVFSHSNSFRYSSSGPGR